MKKVLMLVLILAVLSALFVSTALAGSCNGPGNDTCFNNGGNGKKDHGGGGTTCKQKGLINVGALCDTDINVDADVDILSH